jgi:hypothetical protein
VCCGRRAVAADGPLHAGDLRLEPARRQCRCDLGCRVWCLQRWIIQRWNSQRWSIERSEPRSLVARKGNGASGKGHTQRCAVEGRQAVQQLTNLRKLAIWEGNDAADEPPSWPRGLAKLSQLQDVTLAHFDLVRLKCECVPMDTHWVPHRRVPYTCEP